MKTPEAECVLLATWMKSSVWKCAWAPYCSSWFWKPSPRSFAQAVPGKTCMQQTWSSSLKSLDELQQKLIPGKPACNERDFGSTRAKPRSWYLGRGLMCFGSSGQHGQNQGPDIWAGAWCASGVWQRPPWRMSQRRRYKFHLLYWLFQLDLQEMQRHLWPSEVWCQLHV